MTFLVLALGLLARCGDGSAPRASDATIPPNLTLDEVYARMEQALDGGEGRVLHASITDETKYSFLQRTPEVTEDSASMYAYDSDLWFDALTMVARVETTVTTPAKLGGGTSRRIVREDGTFSVSETGTSRDTDTVTCRRDNSVVLAELLGCRSAPQESTTSIEASSYEGRAAIVLLTKGILPWEESSPAFEERVYVDPTSYLPLGSDRLSVRNRHSRADWRGNRRYSLEFVDRSTLTTNFFEPSAIGYVKYDPVARLRPDVDGMRVYWLGPDFDRTGATLLLLTGAGYPRKQAPYNYRAVLDYGWQTGRRSFTKIFLEEFDTDAWVKNGFDSVNGESHRPEAQREDISLRNGRAVLYRVPGAQERYTAYVYFDTTVVPITDGGETSPYSNREAMLALIKGLRPFE